MLDAIDRQILTVLQENARTPHAELARRIGMAASAVVERVRKLEERGVIRGYALDLDPRAVDLGLLAFVFVRTTDRGSPETAERLAHVPGVLEVHDVAGEDCYLVKVRAASPEDLYERLRDTFNEVPSVLSTRTTIVLKTLKTTTVLPMPDDGVAPSRDGNREGTDGRRG
ncbi:MAG TPA: Lrp/AsnC family transcriptional regulator [Gemmatirosa sp.]